jgi:hypothetical protein
MNMPGFTAETSLYATRGRYRTNRMVASPAGGVVPAIPACANCDDILDRCAANGGKPRAVCNACATGHCYSGEENPGGRCWYDGLHNKVVCDL